MATLRRIIAGPSKADLQLALFEDKRVEFTLEGLGKIEVALRSVGWESGSLNDWLISGYLIHKDDKGETWQHFDGYFNSQRRQGTTQLQETCKLYNCGRALDDKGRCPEHDKNRPCARVVS